MERLLTQHGYPPDWATCTLDRLIDMLGPDDPMVEGIRGFLTGTGRLLHCYGPPNPARQVAFAVTLRGLLLKHRTVNIFNTAELAIEYFKRGERDEFRMVRGPVVLTLGDEMEKKLGAFFFRQCLDKAVAWRMPLAVFTDHSLDSLSRDYFSFSLKEIMTSAGFTHLHVYRG